MRHSKTARGFVIYKFKDEYGAPCSLQKSSSAMQDCVWLGPDGPPPTYTAEAWSPYTRMHLTRRQAKALIQRLQVFVDTGELP